MNSPAPISDDAFAQVVRHTPLVSIDFIILDHRGMVLTGLRTNEPARDTYFVPGGAIRKNETIRNAYARIMQAELGFTRDFDDAVFMGAFEHFYDTNRFGHPDYGTHYVVLAYRLELPDRPPIKPDAQHRAFRWMTPEQILAAPDVHPNTQAYFR